MTTAVENLKANIELYKNDPAGIQRSVINLLTEASNGLIDVVDPTSPFVFSLEASSLLTASFISENQALNRRQYPFSAQTSEDLYPHMSDRDFVDRFAIPSTAKIIFMIEKQELLNSLVLDSTTGIRKIVIPRNTKVTVANTVFSLQYPVEIRQMTHGGLQVVYDGSSTSPLYTLNSNLITYTTLTTDDGTDYLGFELLMHQFDIISKTSPLNSSSAFYLNVELSDQYYYCRVWVDNGDGTFTEIQTTHTDDIYDPFTPTAVLKVTDAKVEIKIPQIYINNQLLSKSLRVDVYQTKGPIEINLANYAPEQFVTNFVAINKSEEDIFVAPLKTLKNIKTISASITQGGRNEMTFDELRLRVIKNATGAPSIPITNVQIESALERGGYTIVRNIDTITNRVFLATRPMPTPVNSELLTPASASISTLSITATAAVSHDTVIDNGQIITITPDTIYRLNKGVLEIVPSSEVTYIKSLPADQQATVITNGNYFYTPFHYVMDLTNNEFDLRSYYLDSPSIVTRSFVAENDTTLLQVSTSTASLVRTATGYKLRISTSSSDAFKEVDDDQIFVQLAIIPTGDIARAYLEGTLVGLNEKNERIYEFDLSTNFSIDSDGELSMLNFTMYNDTPRIVKVPLQASYDIIYATDTTVGPQWTLSNIDSILGYHVLPANTRAITHEKIQLHFGDSLNYLWCRARSVASEQQYDRWAIDIPATYEQDVYQRDLATGLAFTIVAGEVVYTKLHSAGDPVFDGNGDPVYKHRKGDIKTDSYGVPLIVAPRDLLRQMDILLIEGSYYFATDSFSSDYRKALISKVVGWLTDDLPTMGDELLEKTNIYYYPTTTIGNIKVMVNNGSTVTIDAGQSLYVKLHVRRNVYNNAELRDAISKKTVKVISDALSNTVVSTSDIVDQLRAQYKDDVIAVSFKGLGGDKNYDVVTMLDDSTRLSIRKRLVSRSDETLTLEEAVTIEFVDHELETA